MAEGIRPAPSIALYGRSGSGKSTVARFLLTNHGYQHAKTGVACRKLCRELFGSESKALMNEVTNALRGIDVDVWLRAGLKDLRSDRPVVFDSMRFERDYSYFYVRSYVLVRIEAPLQVRAQRLRRRGQKFDPAHDEEHPAEAELEDFGFDFVISNADDIGSLQRQIEDLLGRQWEGIHARRIGT